MPRNSNKSSNKSPKYKLKIIKPLPLKSRQFYKDAKLILESGLFDNDYYLKTYADVREKRADPIKHYLEYGGFESRNPSKKFDTKYYLYQVSDLHKSGINPLIHYLTIGRDKGIKPLPPTRMGRRRIIDGKIVLKIDILNVNFYDWDGKRLYRGGAERYVYDLAVLLKSKGHKVRMLQNANKPFKKRYRGIEVIGVQTKGKNIKEISEVLNYVCMDADLAIASPLDLACAITTTPTIGVNHGIYWDHVHRNLPSYNIGEYHAIFEALKNIELGVCVDTNFINWVRTYDFNLAKKLTYVPNYYDQYQFHTTKKDFNGKLTFLFPRRLYEARGIFLTLGAFEQILPIYKNVELLIVGQNHDEDVAEDIKQLKHKYKQQVFLEEYPMEKMPEVYKRSHVVLIPTLHSEGTSLSCIEAMATNNALIVTTIGGLSNLVINNYNGIMIDPNLESLVGAIKYLIENRKHLEQLADNALRVVEVFEKRRWCEKWNTIFNEMI